MDNLGDSSLTSEAISRLQNVLVDCGAQDFVENRITEYLDKSVSALDAMADNPEAKTALTELAILATNRSA